MKRVILKGVVLLLLSMIVYGVYAPNLRDEFKAKRDNFLLTQFLEKQKLEIRITRLTSVFKIVESSNRYHVIGQNGEYGAYQFSEDTWAYYCRVFFGRILDITTPSNQDLVARAKIEHLIKKGYSDAQIASIWNCGSSNWEGKVGVNSAGVKYDVPAYVNKFLKLLDKKKA